MKRWNSTFEVRDSHARLRRTRSLVAKQKMNKVGPRTKEWVSAWNWLKPRLEAANRTRCEFDFIPHECSQHLTPAHSKKRREMQGPEIFHVALACLKIHRQLDERMSHEEMESAVMRAIENHGGLILPDRY